MLDKVQAAWNNGGQRRRGRVEGSEMQLRAFGFSMEASGSMRLSLRLAALLGLLLLPTSSATSEMSSPTVSVWRGSDVGEGSPLVGYLVVRLNDPDEWHTEWVSASIAPGCDPMYVGMDCLTGCSHGGRSFSFTCGPTGQNGEAEIVSQERLGPNSARCQVRFKGCAEFQVTATFGEMPQGTCIAPWYSHAFVDHGGASGDTKFTLWMVQHPLTVWPANPNRGQAPFIAASVLGPVQTVPSDGIFEPYRWQSSTGATQNGTLNTWIGKIVQYTRVWCTVTVLNPYYPDAGVVDTWNQYSSGYFDIFPASRNWSTGVSFAENGEPSWQNSVSEFPGLAAFKTLGQNTNADVDFRDLSTEIATPLYFTNQAYESTLEGMLDEVTTGPNDGVWFVTAPPYVVDRISRFNYWTQPGAPYPAQLAYLNPATIFGMPGSYAFTNWQNLQTVAFGDTCECSDPGSHGGVGGCIRHRANVYHEGYATPGMADPFFFGHQEAILYRMFLMTGSPCADPNVLCEDDTAASAEMLKLVLEGSRALASMRLRDFTKLVDSNTSSDPTQHNFYGRIAVVRTSSQPYVWAYSSSHY